MNQKFIAIAYLDVDGTSTINGVHGDTWSAISIEVGAKPNDQKKIFAKFLGGELSHHEMVDANMDLWEKAYAKKVGSSNERKSIPESAVSKSLENVSIRPEIRVLVKELIEKRVLPIFITGSFHRAAKYLAHTTGLTNHISDDTWYGNTKLVFDNKGFLTGYKHKGNIPEDKLKNAVSIFEKIAKKYDLDSNTPKFAVGDGASDHKLLEKLIGIAVYADEETIRIADYRADSLNEVKDIILFHLDKI